MTAIDLPTGIQNMTSMGSYMNTATSGKFWLIVLIAFYVIMFIITQRVSTSARAAGTTGFIVAIIAIFMFIIGYIAWTYMFMAILVGVFGIVALYLEGRSV